MPVGLTRHRHVPEAPLVVGHPEGGVFSFSGLFADGGLELAIDGTLEVADVDRKPSVVHLFTNSR